jgi:hypothetical protein
MQGVCALFLLHVIAAAGCSTTQKASVAPESRTSIEAVFKHGPLQPSRASVAIDDLVRPCGSVATYEVLSGKRKGKRIVQRVSSTLEHTILEEMLIDETAVKADSQGQIPSERMMLERRADGALVLREVATHDEDSLSKFAEGLPFAIPNLTAPTDLEGGSAMQVLTLSAGKDRGNGRARRSLRITGEADVEFAGTRARATVLELTFDVTLDVAEAHVRSTIFVVPGRGIVGEERREEVRILGIFPRRRDETTVLIQLESRTAPNGPTP